ncbi:MAG: alpha-galactosidase [Lentisphaeria bacterium]|nr:alpha-galactosidase [Lentisphaeria bacterium]
MKVGLFYQSEQYDSLEHSGNYGKLAVKVPGHSGIMQMRFSVPILDMHGYWVPESRTPSTKIVWVIESKSAGQRAFPFIAFFNSRQINRLSAGLTNLTDDARILAKMNQEKCTYDITIEVALGKDSQDFELVIDQRPQVWTDSLADWRKALALPLPEFPEGAWEPVFCTWYAVHAAVTQDWVEKNAEVASRLGFRTLIIDDGWCFDVMKRVSPETISTWYEMIGDWFLSEKKFPDFENHRKRVQAMGMKYLLWVAPFLIGAKSELYKQLADIVKPEYHEGCYTFDSSRKEAAKLLLGKMKHVIQDYGLDGLKVDFLDYIFPNMEEPRGEDTTHFIQELARTIREVKKDALIEFRQAYATPGMLAYGTQFRAGDVPFDFIDNFHRLAQIRISVGDGVPVHADPAYWHPQESPENISRHMIASLAGVPMLSMDLLAISETEQKIIRHWLGFYQAHRETFNYGKWDVTYHQSGTAYAMVSNERENIIILHDSARIGEALAKAAKHVFVLNLSPDELPLAGAKTADYEGKASADGIIPLGGLGEKE